METAQGDAMHGEYKMPGGKLVVIDLGIRDGRLTDVQLSGDFFLEPDSALQTINATLEGQPVDTTETALALVISGALDADVAMYGISPESIAVVVHRALQGAGDA
jgi:lipoate-protein ligase A